MRTDRRVTTATIEVARKSSDGKQWASGVSTGDPINKWRGGGGKDHVGL